MSLPSYAEPESVWELKLRTWWYCWGSGEKGKSDTVVVPQVGSARMPRCGADITCLDLVAGIFPPPDMKAQGGSKDAPKSRNWLSMTNS